MSYLLDTDVVSGFNKDTLPAKLAGWLAKHEGDSFLSVVSVAEMRYGLAGADAAFAAQLEARLEQTEARFAHALEALDVDTLTRWKGLLAELKTVNRTMTCEDSLIAATALAKGYTLATQNTRHFAPAEQFGLAVVNPLA